MEYLTYQINGESEESQDVAVVGGDLALVDLAHVGETRTSESGLIRDERGYISRLKLVTLNETAT